MTELTPELKRALAHVGADVDGERTDAMWSGLVVKRRRRAVRRTMAAAAVVLLAGAGLLYRGHAQRGAIAADPAPAIVDPARPPAPSDPTIRFADGSTATPADAATRIDIVRNRTSDVAVTLRQGKGRFVVEARPERQFHVSTQHVRVTVYAAEFSVSRTDARTLVVVERGFVELEYTTAAGKQTRRLATGESASFPVEETATTLPEPAPEVAVEPKPARRRPSTPAQRRLAVSELLARADAARMGQRPHDAIAPLTRVVREFSSDPRAAMASFTLGRIYLSALAQPRAAARAFRRVQSLAPRGPLAEDALAREVESWVAAGQLASARERAVLYLKRYPNGHRARAMKKYAE